MAWLEHRRCLLISNSTAHGEGYLDHCQAEMLDFLDGRTKMAFVPFALYDRELYGRRAKQRFEAMGIDAGVVTADEAGRRLVDEAQAFFVGGGNTFRLVDTLQRTGLLEALRSRARSGVPYMGASAGSNIAAPTLCTTNDMPIVEPPSFETLALVGFQINPHFLDTNPEGHMGETREQRLEEYLEENERSVVGLREGAWARVEGATVQLGGSTGARIFTRGREPGERVSGDSLADLESF
jgi:dipeptidase E